MTAKSKNFAKDLVRNYPSCCLLWNTMNNDFGLQIVIIIKHRTFFVVDALLLLFRLFLCQIF